jgi:hypothetical protein
VVFVLISRYIITLTALAKVGKIKEHGETVLLIRDPYNITGI